jgi:putative transposase
MPQSLAKIMVHIIFSTKNREPFLIDASIRSELHAYLAARLKHSDSPALVVGGTSDHVHILSNLSKNHPLSKVVGEVKRASSKWIKSKSVESATFHWQSGYSAFSVSVGNLRGVRNYIINQEMHHQKRGFEDELLELLRQQGIEFDERYLWD